MWQAIFPWKTFLKANLKSFEVMEKILYVFLWKQKLGKYSEMTLQKTFHQKHILLQVTEIMKIHIHGNTVNIGANHDHFTLTLILVLA